MKFAHEGKELIAVNGCLDVKVETVLKLALRDLAALEFHEIDTGCIETGHNAEKGTGAIRYIYHNAGAVGT